MSQSYELHGLHSPSQPLDDGVEVTPSDSTDLAVTPTRALYIGTTGNLKVTMYGGYDKDGNAIEGNTITWKNVPVGLWGLRVMRVHDTGTTAQDIVAGY